MTEKARNADFRRKLQIFADSPLLLEIPAFGGRRKQQKTAGFCRKPQIFAEPQIGLRHLRSVTFSSALKVFRAGCPCDKPATGTNPKAGLSGFSFFLLACAAVTAGAKFILGHIWGSMRETKLCSRSLCAFLDHGQRERTLPCMVSEGRGFV